VSKGDTWDKAIGGGDYLWDCSIRPPRNRRGQFKRDCNALASTPELPALSVEPYITSSASEASDPEVNKLEVNIFEVPMADTNKSSLRVSAIILIPLVAA
jgi:hypothetical protein